MTMRKSFSLAAAAALVATGLTYAQQSDPAAGQVETQQTNQSAQRDQQATQRDQQAVQREQQRQLSGQQQIDANGQQSVRREQTSQHESQEHQAGYRGQTARMEKGRTERLSEIMDMNVRNAQNEELGEIEDVVIDVESGKIRYAALSVGGFLGVGDKLIAVPWDAFKMQQSAEDQDERFLALNVDRQRIENAPGFNEENWPDFGNERYTREVDVYYGGQESTQRSTLDNRSSLDQRSSTDLRSSSDAQQRSLESQDRSSTNTNREPPSDTQNRTGTGTRNTSGAGAGSPSGT
jgi:sporulation protein YlmC with PRC-barrel domain